MREKKEKVWKRKSLLLNIPCLIGSVREGRNEQMNVLNQSKNKRFCERMKNKEIKVQKNRRGQRIKKQK